VCVCVCVCVNDRERESVCERVTFPKLRMDREITIFRYDGSTLYREQVFSERERESVCVCVYVCVCVCVC